MLLLFSTQNFQTCIHRNKPVSHKDIMNASILISKKRCYIIINCCSSNNVVQTFNFFPDLNGLQQSCRNEKLTREKDRGRIPLQLAVRQAQFLHLFFTPNQLFFANSPHSQSPRYNFDVHKPHQHLHFFCTSWPAFLFIALAFLPHLLHFHSFL